MFNKLHRQMTFFCILITGIILVIMSFAYLYISESRIKENGYATFLNESRTMMTSLENQSIISYEWISRMENGGKYLIHLSNNGTEILLDHLKNDESKTALLELAYNKAQELYDFSFDNNIKSKVLSQSYDFSMTDEQKNDYYVFCSKISKSDGYIGVFIVYPLAPQKAQITQQRILFGTVNIIAVLLLGIFSYFFTAIMITPIKKNREQQNQFIASASHELRTPLAVILSNLSALKKADAKEQERFTQTIQSEGLRMSRLVNDLLLLASADNHSWNLNLEKVEMDTLLLELYEKFESIAERQKIKLSVDLPPGVISKCICDRVRMEQVLSILLDNAVSYTPEYGTVVMKIREENGKITISVIDNGPGIPDKDKEHIFERFYRSDKSHTQKKHFGLGLCIAEEIVRLHRGKIRVRDTLGGGATFVLQLLVE